MPEVRQTLTSPLTVASRFVVVEGLDGTGTTTVAAALAEALRARDLRVRLTAEPTNGPFGVLLRSHLAREITLDPTTTALVFSADRADHLQSAVRPALARGGWVISDRYLLSTLAYQGAEGVDQAAILGASQGFEIPEATFVLEASDEVRQARMAPRGRSDRYEDPALGERLRAAYDDAIALLRDRGDRIEVVDATLPVRQVVEDLLARLDAAR